MCGEFKSCIKREILHFWLTNMPTTLNKFTRFWLVKIPSFVPFTDQLTHEMLLPDD